MGHLSKLERIHHEIIKRLDDVETWVRFWVRNEESRDKLLESVRSLIDYGRAYGKQEAAS